MSNVFENLGRVVVGADVVGVSGVAPARPAQVLDAQGEVHLDVELLSHVDLRLRGLGVRGQEVT